MRDIEKTVTASQLSAGCADLYIDFTRDWILKPAGAFATRTRAPQNPKSVNFAYLYNWNDHSTQGLMPDRRLNIGSGGWAMSAKEYGKFLSALFDEELLSANIKVGNSWFNTIDYMKANNLGMFPAWGSTNEDYKITINIVVPIPTPPTPANTEASPSGCTSPPPTCVRWCRSIATPTSSSSTAPWPASTTRAWFSMPNGRKTGVS